MLANASMDVALHDTIQIQLDLSYQLLLLPFSFPIFSSGLATKKLYSSYPNNHTIGMTAEVTKLTELDYFYQFLVGLIDGDGSFQVNHWRCKILQFRIVIKLKNTLQNIQLLTEIKNRLGVGKLYINNNGVVFQIDNRQEIASIIDIFNTYPLLTTSMRSRFAFFKFCFIMRAHLSYTDYLQLKQNFILMDSSLTSTTDLLNLNYFKTWLVGFTSAEGCFSIRKNGYHSFSISQTYDTTLINAIKIFFKIPNKVRFISAKNGKPFYLIETYNRATLLRIIEFFDDTPIKLGGEKLVQYNKFKDIVLSRA